MKGILRLRPARVVAGAGAAVAVTIIFQTGIPFFAKQPTLVRFPAAEPDQAMIPAVVVLLLLTALVATDSAAPGGEK